MTQAQADPWAAAQQGNSAPAQTEGSQLAGSFAPPASSQKSQLFNSGAVAPSLLNKLHGVGTERTGIITKAPYDRQAVDFNTKSPKYFLQTPEIVDGRSRKVGSTAVDPTTGKPNQPVMDTFLELDTDYAMDAGEASAVGRETPFEGGARVFVAGGADLKVLREAIGDAVKRGIPIVDEESMVGLRFTVKRVGQKPNTGGNPSWITAMRLDRA